MLTISCYTFHPLALRFVRLWKHVQVVSDWLVCVLSVFCCQCESAMPLSDSSSETDALPTPQPQPRLTAHLEKPSIDSGRASGEPLRPQHAVLDFSPQPQDEPVVSRCIQLWELIHSQHELDGIMVTPDAETLPNDAPKVPALVPFSVPIHKQSKVPLNKPETLPAIKALNNIQDKGAISTVFQTAIGKHG